MKNSFKKAIIIAVCAVLTFSAVAPSFALTGTDSDSHIDYGLGVQVDCSSTINSIRGNGTVTISFVSGVPHFPQSDYTCKAEIRFDYSDGSYSTSTTTNAGSMTANVKKDVDNSKTLSTAEFSYFVNNFSVYTKTFS